MKDKTAALVCAKCNKPIAASDKLAIAYHDVERAKSVVEQYLYPDPADAFFSTVLMPFHAECAYGYADGRIVTGRNCPACGRALYTYDGKHPKGYGTLKCNERCRLKAKTIRRRKPTSERACSVCGDSFTAKRPDAKFCSVRCRQQAHRSGHDYPVAALSKGQRQQYESERQAEAELERKRQAKLDEIAQELHAMLDGS